MKKHDKIIDGLARAARPPGAETALPPGLATRVLAEVRSRAVGEAVAPGYLGVLERWLVGALPAALVVAGGVWISAGRAPGPRPVSDAPMALADVLFEEALRP